MQEVVDLAGGDSDDDLSGVNKDVHVIALTLPHQIQPQEVMQGSLPHAGGNHLPVHQVNIPIVVSSQ